MNALPVCVLQFHAKILEDFQALRAVLDVLFQPRRHALAESGRVQVVVTHVGEDHKPVGVASLHHLDRLPQLLARPAAQVHHHAQVDGIHALDELIHLCGSGVPMMAVDINERKFGAFGLVRLGDQRGLWLVLINGRGLLRSLCGGVLVRHGLAGPDDEHPKQRNKRD